MQAQENDPDTLQLLDETDKEWVKLWRKAALKEKPVTLQHFVLRQENMEQPHLQTKSKR